MKIGDFVLKANLQEIQKQVSLMSVKDKEMAKMIALANAFLIDMMTEIIESPTIEKKNMTPQEMAMFSLRVITSVACVSVFRYAKRCNDFDAYVNNFKHQFEEGMKNIMRTFE